MKSNSSPHSSQFSGRPFDVLNYLKLVLERVTLSFDVFESHVDDGHHHVDKDHVDDDGEDEEDPGGCFTCGSQSSKVELSNAHCDRVLDCEWERVEVLQVGSEDEVEETAEGSKDDDKLDDKGGESNEAELDCSSNLFERLLKAEQPTKEE